LSLIPSVFLKVAKNVLVQIADKGSADLKFNLPGFGYIDQFVRTYCSISADQRSDYLKHIFSSDPHCKALKRYGGVEKSFYLVLGDTMLPGFMAANFTSEAQPQPTVRDAATSVLQIGQFVGIPEDLSR
jgi:hypothetical protein